MNSISKLKTVISEHDLLSKVSGGFMFKALSIGLNYLFILLITKLYGVDAWGIMAICLSFLNIVSIFGKMGVDVSVLRFASTYKNDISHFYSIYFKGLKIILLFSFILTFVTFINSDFIASKIFNKNYLGEYIRVVSLGIIPYCILFLNAQLYRAEEKTKEYFLIVDVFKYLLPIILVVFIYRFSHFVGSLVAVYSFIVALYISMAFSCIRIYAKGKIIINSCNISKTKILKTAIPLFLGSSAILIMGWVDTLVIGFYRTELETGVYNILVKISQVPTIVLIAVNGILASKISYFYNNNQLSEYRDIVLKSSKMIFFGSIPLFLVLLLFYPFLFNMFGITGNDAFNVFCILLFGQFVNIFSGSVALILQMIGKQKIFSQILLLGLFINVILNFFLIPKIGLIGAASATAFSQIVWNLVAVYYVKKITNVFTFYFPSRSKL